MRGTILGFSEVTNEGMISGEDNNRYSFSRGDWKSDRPPISGRGVDFVGADGKATEIYVQPSAFAAGFSAGDKNRVIAALLAFFLGGFGFHKFYLGQNKAGIIMLVVCLMGFFLLGIPSLIIGVIAFIEAILYITKSDADFDATYVHGRRAWF